MQYHLLLCGFVGKTDQYFFKRNKHFQRKPQNIFWVFYFIANLIQRSDILLPPIMKIIP